MEEVNITGNVTGYAWECKQATGTHSHLCTNLSLQPGRRNGANSKLSPFDTRSARRRQGWLLFLQMLSSCWCFWKWKGILTGGCGPAPILPGRLQSSSLPISPIKATQSIASTGSSGDSAILRSHITREDSLAVGVHRAIPQHKWQLFPWGTTLEGLCYVTVNWYVTASKCSWRKACASNDTPACPDHLLGLLTSTTLNELCTVLAHQHVYVKYVCWAREIDSHIKTAERSAQDRKKIMAKDKCILKLH